MAVILTRQAFEELVAQVLETLPEPFQRALENVAIVIEREPRIHHRRQVRARVSTLSGFYEIIPLPVHTSV